MLNIAEKINADQNSKLSFRLFLSHNYVIQLCSYVVFYLLNLLENYTVEIDAVLEESFNS